MRSCDTVITVRELNQGGLYRNPRVQPERGKLFGTVVGRSG